MIHKRVIAGIFASVAFSATAAPARQPNILLILADDLGFSDLGCYGSEIRTPNIDRLAAGGLRFTQFYNSGKCEPSRACLLSGQYWQKCGLGIKSGITMGQAMRGVGYATFAVGKWHVDGNPVERGFDHYFGHLSGASDYFKGNPSHRLDLEPFKPKADGTFYTTDANADYAIKFLDEAHRNQPDKPFFMYLAFNAPHAPLEAWPEDVKKYRGNYLVGWDKLREQRYQRQLELGIMKPEWKLSPRPATIPAWDTLTAQEKDFEDLRMSIFAAMVDRMDQAIGRILAKVKEMGEEENTIVLFLSDNGASPYDHSKQRNIESVLEGGWEYGLGWANLSATPFLHYKRNTYNGGSCTPFIAYWPIGITKPGSITEQPGHIIDLMATVMDLSGGKWPAEYEGAALAPLPGLSLRPIFAGEQRVPHDVLYFHLFDHRAIRVGDYKLASDWGRPWQLFNLAADRTELNDLSAAQPERVKELEKMWTDWSAKSGAEEKMRNAGGEPVYRHLYDAQEKFIGGHGDGDSEENIEVKPAKSKNAKSKSAAKVNTTGGIRARIGTVMAIEGDEIVLTCTGDNPGLAISLPAGLQGPCPWTLTFSLLSQAEGDGDVFYTTDAQTSLPNGRKQIFPVIRDGKPHPYSLAFDNKEPIYALRFDPCSGAGTVRIKGMVLKDAAGQVLCTWPKTSE
jgi:arylsulfatase